MKVDVHDSDWLDPHGTVSQAELSRMCRLSVAELEELVEYGLLVPAAGRPAAWTFHAGCVQPLRQAAALRGSFDLDVFVLGLLFSQLERIAHLEQQLRALHAHLPPHAVPREGPASWREPHG